MLAGSRQEGPGGKRAMDDRPEGLEASLERYAQGMDAAHNRLTSRQFAQVSGIRFQVPDTEPANLIPET
jgi:hypothetical protein